MVLQICYSYYIIVNKFAKAVAIMKLDHEYMAQMLAGLSGLPVRLYEKNKFVTLYHHSKWKPDLAILEEQKIFEKPGYVSYYMTDTFLFFGLFRVKGSNVSLVIGPVAQVSVNQEMARNILRSIGEPISRKQELLDYLTSIPAYPLQNFLQILCAFSYFINGEKISVNDLLTDEIDIHSPGAELPLAAQKQTATFVHDTYDLEQELLAIVENGRTDELRELFRSPATGRAGILSDNALRQQKNLFICSATLVTRAAIRGGMDREAAFVLSDIYIQKAELIKSCPEIAALQAQMIMDFTERTADAQAGGRKDPLLGKARGYILQNISRAISTDELARWLGLNRTYLCRLFRQQTGKSVGEYITGIKMAEAKRLLSLSKKSLREISDYLGYSSQSHFQNTFKREVGITPGEWREQSR